MGVAPVPSPPRLGEEERFVLDERGITDNKRIPVIGLVEERGFYELLPARGRPANKRGRDFLFYNRARAVHFAEAAAYRPLPLLLLLPSGSTNVLWRVAAFTPVPPFSHSV